MFMKFPSQSEQIIDIQRLKGAQGPTNSLRATDFTASETLILAMSQRPNERIMRGFDEDLHTIFIDRTQDNDHESVPPNLENINFMPYQDVLGSIGEDDIFGDINTPLGLGHNAFQDIHEHRYGPRLNQTPQHVDPALLIQNDFTVPAVISGLSHTHSYGQIPANDQQLAYSAPAAPFGSPFYGDKHGLTNPLALAINPLHGTFSPASSCIDQPVFSPEMGALDFPSLGFIRDLDYTTTSSQPALLLEEPPVQRVNPPKDGRQTDEEYIEIDSNFVHHYADFDAVKRKLNEIKGNRSQNIHDNTYPTSREHQRMYVKRIFLATRDGRTTKTFRQGKPANKQPQAYNLCVLLKGKDEDLVQLKCWEWLKAQMKAHQRSAPFTTFDQNADASFESRIEAFCEALRTQKEIAKRLLIAPYLAEIIEDPVKHTKRVASNLAVNNKKQDALLKGRLVQAKERAGYCDISADEHDDGDDEEQEDESLEDPVHSRTTRATASRIGTHHVTRSSSDSLKTDTPELELENSIISLPRARSSRIRSATIPRNPGASSPTMPLGVIKRKPAERRPTKTHRQLSAGDGCGRGKLSLTGDLHRHHSETSSPLARQPVLESSAGDIRQDLYRINDSQAIQFKRDGIMYQYEFFTHADIRNFENCDISATNNNTYTLEGFDGFSITNGTLTSANGSKYSVWYEYPPLARLFDLVMIGWIPNGINQKYEEWLNSIQDTDFSIITVDPALRT